jgi:hypothetical protein
VHWKRQVERAAGMGLGALGDHILENFLRAKRQEWYLSGVLGSERLTGAR